MTSFVKIDFLSFVLVRDLPNHIKFTISITYERKHYTLPVEIERSGDRLEYISFNSAGKRFLLESNRPLFRKKGLWKRNYDVKLVQGHTFNVSLLERVIDAVKDKIRAFESSDPGYENPKNAKRKEGDWDEFEKL